MIKYKCDIMQKLKENGYTPKRIRDEKLMGQSYLQQLRKNELVSWKTLNTICYLTNCQIGDLLEYIPDENGGINSEKDAFDQGIE